MQEPTQFKLVSSTVAGPRIRMHKACITTEKRGRNCCQLCDGAFIPGHPQLSELMPHGWTESIEEVQKSKRTRKPSRRVRAEASLART